MEIVNMLLISNRQAVLHCLSGLHRRVIQIVQEDGGA